jgi:hypothetical protein
MASEKSTAHLLQTACDCCSSGLKTAYEAAARAGLSRRHLILGASTAAVGAWAATSRAAASRPAETADTPRIAPASKLVVQPVLTYAIPKRRAETSWRSWGGLMTEPDVAEEVARIEKELNRMAGASGLTLDLRPVARVASPAEAARIKDAPSDVMLIYASGGHRGILEALVAPDKPTIFFLRHRSGPVSLHYEILHPHFLRKATDQYAETGVDVNDVVVDDYDDLAWRLKGLLALRRTLGQRIVALGGPMGWGLGRQLAPSIARDKWQLDIRTIGYDDLAGRIEKLQQSDTAAADARRQAAEYLRQPGVTLHTDKVYVENAFFLYRIFKDYLAEHEATAFTIGGCMSTVIPLAKTTACLPLSLLNDEGFLAFCESDFVVIPSGMLMHHITGTPALINDPTWPHHGVVTLAHCTAPRRMDGKRCEPTQIHTHFESDYGAAPKVEMAPGQVVTMVVPDFECRKWVGAKGQVEGNPFHDICRSQIDVTIDGDCQRLVQDMRGFHWMLVYGDCRREVGYAIKHLGIEWEDVSA